MKFLLNKQQAIISFSGLDAANFLQGQITCDVNSLTEQNVLLGALCNPKGRVITVFHLFKRQDVFYMLLSADLLEGLVKRLKMFVFRSKVIIQDVSTSYDIIANDGALETATSVALCQFKLIAESDLSIIITQHSSIELEAYSEDPSAWYAAFDLLGLPLIRQQTSELFVPQMLNLDLIDGISFKKGCYTGQEIVARMHYKGTPKRRLYLFEADQLLEAGKELIIAGNANSLGNIVDCQKLADNKYQGTLVLKIESFSKDDIQLEDGTRLNVSMPPYGFELTKD